MSKVGGKGSFNPSKMLDYPLLSHISKKSPSQQTGNDVEIKTVMYFVIPPGKTEEGCLGLNLGKMYQRAVAHYLNVQWIRDEDCEEIPLESDGNVLVFGSFDSPGFKYWEANAASRPYRVEILGPQVLRYIFNSKEVLSFSTNSCPTYTLAMRNMIIFLSGFKDLAEKVELDQMIRWMNGTISKTWTTAVTIVVTATALTDKSLEAHRSKVPVVTAEWVREAWKDNQKSTVDASKSRSVEKHMCPIFYNVNICLSQIQLTRKRMLKHAVEKLGGKCSPDMRKDETDVLVITAPEGEKYKFATRWELCCVSPEWIESSIKQGYLLPPEHFKVELSIEKVVTSTPAHSFARGEPNLVNLGNTRCSAIIEPSTMGINETNETMRETMDENPRQDVVHVIDKIATTIRASGYLDGLRVKLDVQQFTAEEITVKTVNNMVVIEGMHEEKQDEHGFVSRHFVRKYILPEDVKPEAVLCNLSSDGVLSISAPRIVQEEEAVKVIQTGRPAVVVQRQCSNTGCGGNATTTTGCGGGSTSSGGPISTITPRNSTVGNTTLINIQREVGSDN